MLTFACVVLSVIESFVYKIQPKLQINSLSEKFWNEITLFGSLRNRALF